MALELNQNDKVFLYTILLGSKQSLESAKKHFKHNKQLLCDCETSIAYCESLIGRIGNDINSEIIGVINREK